MMNKLEKVYNIGVTSLFCIYAMIALVLAIALPKYNILFPGWWSLIVIIPSLGSLLFQRIKV